MVHLPALLNEIGLVQSNAEGRRMIDQGGVKIEGSAVAPGTYDIECAEVRGKVVQVGKRRFAKVISLTRVSSMEREGINKCHGRAGVLYCVPVSTVVG